MDAGDFTEVFPETSQAQLPEIPEEEGNEGGDGPPAPPPCERQLNRRFNLRPHKKPQTDIQGNIKKVLYNVIKSKGPLRRQHLETIFEEPIKENGKVILLSVKKSQRSITFTDFVSKAKQRKRKAKAKKVRDSQTDARMNEVQKQFWKMDL